MTNLSIYKKENETPIEMLRRMVSWMNHEPETLLEDLPTPEACIEYFALWQTYDTDFLEGILQCIEEGESAKPLAQFIVKHNMQEVWPFDGDGIAAQRVAEAIADELKVAA